MNENPAKRFISAQELLEASFALALEVLKDGFAPDVIAGIWRGGTPVAIAVHELLKCAGVGARHVPIITSSYSGMGCQGPVTVEGLNALRPLLSPGTKLLLVDDVFESGRSVSAIRAALGAALPADTRVATACYKPSAAVAGHPDYFVIQSNDWLVFPHELEGLTPDEIARHKPFAARFIAEKTQGGHGA